MSSIAISLLDLETGSPECLEAEDYQKRPAKWCGVVVILASSTRSSA